MTRDALQEFSCEKHERGEWNTTRYVSRNRLVRFLWNYCSFKRDGVDRLARRLSRGALVLDAGAGTGAYVHWFAARTRCRCVAVDWSHAALVRLMRMRPAGLIGAVCADAHYLPFKAEIFDGLFSIDLLGHLSDAARALDEMSRVVKPGAELFLHSECSDYQTRWPDRVLIRKLGEDLPARLDGHVGLRKSTDIRRLLLRRFAIASFFSPAGIAGWLLGYPEKYRPAFARAHLRLAAAATGMFACIKKLPVAGALLRLINAFTNHGEVYFGIQGGGSCFAFVKKPLREDGGEVNAV
jgi:SAM-dependent methyltransferase